MNDIYEIRRAVSSSDAAKLCSLFNDVFHPQKVGELAETMFHHLPRMEMKYWFIAEEKASSEIVSAFTLIPWTWSYKGIRLNVAEMGIVGTQEKHRQRGLMRSLNREFDKTLEEEGFDLTFIQGIPGFYQKFGFQYSIPLENHLNLAFSKIPELKDEHFMFRLAGLDDIPFLMKEDEKNRSYYDISSFRDEAIWRYLLTHSLETEYGSEYWIMEGSDSFGPYYLRIPEEGFGEGLIISETSEDLNYEAFISLLNFCKRKAGERDKPYLRFNLHNESTAGRMVLSLGAEQETQHACQIKFPDKISFLKKTSPILEKRMKDSCFNNFSGAIRLDFYTENIDLVWKHGRLENVRPGEGDCAETFCISPEHFPALCLGHRSWRELRYIKPDIFPQSKRCGLMIETLFPATVSWIHEQY